MVLLQQSERCARLVVCELIFYQSGLNAANLQFC